MGLQADYDLEEVSKLLKPRQKLSLRWKGFEKQQRTPGKSLFETNRDFGGISLEVVDFEG